MKVRTIISNVLKLGLLAFRGLGLGVEDNIFKWQSKNIMLCTEGFQNNCLFLKYRQCLFFIVQTPTILDVSKSFLITSLVREFS